MAANRGEGERRGLEGAARGTAPAADRAPRIRLKRAGSSVNTPRAGAASPPRPPTGQTVRQRVPRSAAWTRSPLMGLLWEGKASLRRVPPASPTRPCPRGSHPRCLGLQAPSSDLALSPPTPSPTGPVARQPLAWLLAHSACFPSTPLWVRLREHEADRGHPCSVDFQGLARPKPAGSRAPLRPVS